MAHQLRAGATRARAGIAPALPPARAVGSAVASLQALHVGNRAPRQSGPGDVESGGSTAYSGDMAEGKSPEGSGFTVTDRRSFAERAEPDVPSAPPSAEPAAEATAVPAAPLPSSEAMLPPEPVDFHTFVLSLGSSALLHLGELDQPDGAPVEPDLPLAKHTIDIIAMLAQKTRGNLTSAEAHLIESLLFDLRLRYVERSKSRS